MEETVELVAVKFEKVVQSRSYLGIVLGTEEKKFAIYTDPTSGKFMQMHLTFTKKPRPHTHDLLQRIFRGLEVKVKQVVISDLQDSIYFARLFIEQQRGEILHIVEIDARPSDAITLALLHQAPIYCTAGVVENAIGYAE